MVYENDKALNLGYQPFFCQGNSSRRYHHNQNQTNKASYSLAIHDKPSPFLSG
jgi:ribonuclease I